MTTPQNSEKNLEDWTFEELCKWASWEIVSSMYSGQTLKSSVYNIMRVAVEWANTNNYKNR